MRYTTNLQEAQEVVCTAIAAGRKMDQYVYTTVIHLPKGYVIDFGKATWPPNFLKKEVCPLVLVAQGWIDGRFGFIGGMVEKGETIITAMEREFQEESGTAMSFSNDDYLFSVVKDASIEHMYIKVIENRQELQQILINFHSNPSREAYIDEIFALSAVPLFMESPDKESSSFWRNNPWGLPRLLAQHGGFLTPTLTGNNLVRDQLLLSLLCTGIIEDELMQKIFDLTKMIDVNFQSFEEFLTIDGRREVIDYCRTYHNITKYILSYK